MTGTVPASIEWKITLGHYKTQGNFLLFVV